MSDRIIPLADAPAPNPENLEPDAPATQPAQDAPFTPEPLNTLKFKPPSRRSGLESVRP